MTRHFFAAKLLPTCAAFALHQVAKDNAVNESLIETVGSLEVHTTRHVLGAKVLPICETFALHQVAKDNAVIESLIKKVQRNFYMDKFPSQSQAQEATDIYQKVRASSAKLDSNWRNG